MALLWFAVFIPCFLLNVTPLKGDMANYALMLATLMGVAVGVPMLRNRAYRSARAALALMGGAL